MSETRRFHIRTYGCQMNVHDSEKVANLLRHRGWHEASEESAADLLLINTCSIREKAEHRLYSDLGALAEWKRERPGRALGVGGCVAQQEGDALLRRFDQLDFAFGTHNLRLVADLAEGAAAGRRSAEVGFSADPTRFDLPSREVTDPVADARRAFVTVMEGCDMFCSFCVVPHTRGREISRPWRDIVEEVATLADQGIREVTLLGQTVNAYGRHDRRRARGAERGTVPFTELLERIAGTPGIERVRYTSPHPRFFDDDLVAAHGSLSELCPHVHLPAQSGADPVLERMRRRYTAGEFLDLVARLRRARPDLAITTDLIVGFPGERDEDFEQTLALVAAARFVDSFSFKYSPRPETAAASFSDAVPGTLAQERLERLQHAQRELTIAYHRSRVGSVTEVWITGASRRGGGQLQGRDPYNRVVNLSGLGAAARAGDRVAARVVDATPHSLIGERIDHARLKRAVVRADEGERGTLTV